MNTKMTPNVSFYLDITLGYFVLCIYNCVKVDFIIGYRICYFVIHILNPIGTNCKFSLYLVMWFSGIDIGNKHYVFYLYWE